MHATITMRNKDLEICLNDCQQRQYPFTFWDEKEMAGFDLGALPMLKKVGEDWEERGPYIIVDLTNKREVGQFKRIALKYIVELENDKREIGFAIISDKSDRKNGPLVTIQIYQKK